MSKMKCTCGHEFEYREEDTQPNLVTLGFCSPPYWVGKAYEYQANVAEIDTFIRRAAASYNAAVSTDNSRIVINTGTGFTTSMAGKKKRQTLLLMDKWANAFFDLGWNLRHVRHWIKRGQLLAIASKNDIIDQHCEFIGTFESDAGAEMKFDDRLWESDTALLETFYNVKGGNRGHFKTGAKWAVQGFWDDIRGNAQQTGHIAAFPVQLVIRHLFLYTQAGEKVLDLFLGSGTTIIACQKMARQGYGMEMDPLYIDLTIRRFMQYAPNEQVICLTRDMDTSVYRTE